MVAKSALLLQLLIGCLSLSTLLSATKINGLHAYYRSSRKLEQKAEEDVDTRGGTFKIGFGIGDITGPAAEINMMGYAKLGQDSRGIHTRLYARTMIVADRSGACVCYVNVDLAASTQIVKLMVIEELEKIYGKSLFRHENVMISATHTHSGPGGYFQYLLYIITQEGYIKDSTNAIVAGITKSIRQAHDSLTPGRIHYNEGMLLHASINRSPASYALNPDDEIAKYKYNTEKTMQTLKFVDHEGKPLGMASWFAVHGTSMNNSNKLISSDNKGYAAMRFEQDINSYTNVGKGPFVAIFAQANEGDVSPNVKGPRCIDTGLPCDFVHSTCNNRNELCVAHGPGKDMFESTKIIGEMQYKKAKELFSDRGELVSGSVHFIYQNINMTDRNVTLANGTVVQTCSGALGYSFAAGTTDGEGAVFFRQGTTSGSESLLWDYLRNIITHPSKKLLDCQLPKAVLFPVGEMKYPYAWTPEIMPTQIFEIGNIVLVGLPAEFTTMAGRRIREDVLSVYKERGRKVHVILSGLSNTYSNYVTTFEEYQLQRYEGGSTLYGPYTLDAYREQFKYLATSLVSGESVSFGPKFPNLLKSQITFKPGVFFDTPMGNGQYGEVLTDALDHYYAGSQVKVRFVGANPRNNLRLEDTYLTVDRLVNGSTWVVHATDAHWETMFIWTRNNTFLGTSEVTLIWSIPTNTEPGTYRIRYFGDQKNYFQQIASFSGSTKPFKVRSLSELKNEIDALASNRIVVATIPQDPRRRP